MRWVDENSVERLQYSLMYQLSHITHDKQSLVHDDRLDAVALGCMYVKDMVIVDADRVLKDMKAKEEQDIIDSMIDGTYGPDTVSNTPSMGSMLGGFFRG